MVPPASHRTFVSHGTWERDRGISDFGYEAFTLSGHLFRDVLLSSILPYLPPHNLPRLGYASLGIITHYFSLKAIVLSETMRSIVESKDLGFSAFARRYLRNLTHSTSLRVILSEIEGSFVFLFLTLLRCFSSGGAPRITIPPPKAGSL